MAKEKFTKKELEEVAEDLNKIFEQPIPTGKKTTVTSLKKDLLEAAQEIQESDDISDKSKEILTWLRAKLPEMEEEKLKAKEEKQNSPTKTITKEKKEKDEKTDLTIGTKSYLFYEAIKEKPMTMVDVKKLEWNKNKATYFGTFAKLKKLGIMKKDEEGKICLV